MSPSEPLRISCWWWPTSGATPTARPWRWPRCPTWRRCSATRWAWSLRRRSTSASPTTATTGPCPTAGERQRPSPSPTSGRWSWQWRTGRRLNSTRRPRAPISATPGTARSTRSGSRTPGACPQSCASSPAAACGARGTGTSCAPIPRAGRCSTLCMTSYNKVCPAGPGGAFLRESPLCEKIQEKM